MSPDLNAPTRSKQPSSPIRLVLGKFDPDRSEQWDAPFDCVELDTGLWFGLSAAKRARYRKRFRERGVSVLARTVLRPIRDPESLPERLRLVEEELEGLVRLQILASGRRVFEPEPVDLWIPSIQESLTGCHTPVMLEWGEQDGVSGMSRWIQMLPGTGWLIDPDRHRVTKKQLTSVVHHKLHGWHPVRWVRRYGAQRAVEIAGKIAKRLRSADEGFLVLSHSGRIEEFEVFSKAISTAEG